VTSTVSDAVRAILDDPARVASLDGHDVRGVLAAFPEQCRRALEIVPSPPPTLARPRVVIVAGMGGSAAGGDILAACAAESVDVPVLVHRGYGLPATAGPHALVIASSYSGETAEVLSAAETALARTVPLVAVTTGGRLGALVAGQGGSVMTLPGGLMPRMALGYLFFPALTVLARAGVEVASAAEVAEALDVLAELARQLAPARPTSGNEAKRLAVAIGTRLPAVYGGPVTGAVAYRWKTELNENAKAFALAGALPEMNHNEIEAWRGAVARGMQVVLLRDREEAAEIARRFAVLTDLIGTAAGGVVEYWTAGKGRLARLLSTAYVGQWTSYYLALLRGVDPWPIPVLDELKRRMSRP
jgi:glucose/mannose-6-phosphate isomerase